ncbi:MAG: helix-turn-helix domain-containing protein [Gammaproteobacteria bacterium]|nr:helix-turn-helix domain-containing protein [Gammaproteobacteria bacterium]
MVGIADAARALGVSESTVWRMIRRGALPSVRQGGRRLVPSGALRASLRKKDRSRIPPLSPDHGIFRLVGAGRSGGSAPGARDKRAILDE